MTTKPPQDPTEELIVSIVAKFDSILRQSMPAILRLATDDAKNKADADLKLKFDMSHAAPACGITLAHGPKKTKISALAKAEDPNQTVIGGVA